MQLVPSGAAVAGFELPTDFVVDSKAVPNAKAAKNKSSSQAASVDNVNLPLNSSYFSIESASFAKGTLTPLALAPHESGILGPVIFTPREARGEERTVFYVKNNLTRAAELVLLGVGARGQLEFTGLYPV
jgi:hypothetical protein